jgi:TPR repeat protein
VHQIGVISLCLLLASCAHTPYSPGALSHIQQGKRDYQAGLYRKALQQLMPEAQAGYPEAQYTVGYLYYYGQGVAPDQEVGILWIARAAKQGYPPAIRAMRLIRAHQDEASHP